MISLAHPDFRAELFEKAKEKGYMTPGRKLGDSIRSVYPAALEEKRKTGDATIVYRPAKPVDIRRIQEHFYNLDRKDVIARFFYEKTQFLRNDIENIAETDYVRNLTLLAITGEFGFGSVVGIGAYMLERAHNIAEVAFSVSRGWQGKGIAATLLNKLADAAQDNGISGLVAYTDPSNQAMIKLFHKLPFTIHKKREDDIIVLNCFFEAKPDTPETS